MINRLLFPLVSRLIGRSFTPTLSAPRPDAPPFAQRGGYAVGTREFALPDPERPLKITVWYPASNPDNAPQYTTYSEGAGRFAGRALRNAAPFLGDAPYPLVIFSHGSGGLRLQSLFLTEHLASHGMVVMGVDHSGNTVFDGMLAPEKYEINRIKSYVERPADVLRQIAYAESLTAPGGMLAGVWDMQRIAVAGHSFGGYTALAVGGACLDFESLDAWCADPQNAEFDAQAYGSVCYLRHHIELFADMRKLDHIPQGLWEPTSDPRVRAVVAMAPWNAPIFGARGLSQMHLPALILVGSNDYITVPERDAFMIYEHIGSPLKLMGVFQQAGHFIFVDECTEIMRQFGMFDICSDKVWDMARAHDLINHMTTAFLRAILYDDADARQALAEARFPGLNLQSKGLLK